MKEITIREICGDYALDIPFGNNTVFTLYFNSYQNALNVKRIIDVDGNVPNVATVCDMVEIVRCENCDLWNEWDAHGRRELGNYVCSCAHWSTEDGCVVYTKPNDFCSYGERKDGEQA